MNAFDRLLLSAAPSPLLGFVLAAADADLRTSAAVLLVLPAVALLLPALSAALRALRAVRLPRLPAGAEVVPAALAGLSPAALLSVDVGLLPLPAAVLLSLAAALSLPAVALLLPALSAAPETDSAADALPALSPPVLPPPYAAETDADALPCLPAYAAVARGASPSGLRVRRARVLPAGYALRPYYVVAERVGAYSAAPETDSADAGAYPAEEESGPYALRLAA